MAAYKFDGRNYNKTLIVDKDGKLINLTGTPTSTSDTDYKYRLITFTADGWIVTHGKAYNGTGISDKLNFGTGHGGSILYIDSTGDSVLLATTDSNDGQVLKYSKSDGHPIWTTDIDTRYKITINGTDSTYTTGSENSLGTIYAPISAPSSASIPSYNSGWSWNSIISSIDNTSGIPTSAAVKSYVDTATAGLTSAMHYRGTTTVSDTTTNSVRTITVTAISGITFISGDVVVANASSTKPSAEYVYDGTSWRELGDEGSYLLKTAKPLSSTNSTLSIGTGDIGTGITLDLPSITQNNTTPTGTLTYAGTFTAVTGVTRDSYGRVTGVATTTYTMPSTDEIDYSSALYWASNTTKATANPNSATSNPYLLLILNNTLKAHVLFDAGTGISISAKGEVLTVTNTGVTGYTATVTSSTTNKYTIGTLKINGSDTTVYGVDTNTWRPVNAYVLASLNATTTTASAIRETSTGTNALCFGSEFVSIEADSNTNMPGSEIHLCWAEIDDKGNLTYAV